MMQECPKNFDNVASAKAFAAVELSADGAPDYKVIQRGLNGKAELLVFTDDIEIRDGLEALGYTVRSLNRYGDFDGL